MDPYGLYRIVFYHHTTHCFTHTPSHTNLTAINRCQVWHRKCLSRAPWRNAGDVENWEDLFPCLKARWATLVYSLQYIPNHILYRIKQYIYMYIIYIYINLRWVMWVYSVYIYICVCVCARVCVRLRRGHGIKILRGFSHEKCWKRLGVVHKIHQQLGFIMILDF